MSVVMMVDMIMIVMVVMIIVINWSSELELIESGFILMCMSVVVMVQVSVLVMVVVIVVVKILEIIISVEGFKVGDFLWGQSQVG